MIVIVAAMGVRPAILVGLAIPGSFLAGILVIYGMGLTLNIVVLFSLILVVGMLVDGAIVEVENAYKKLELWEHGGRKGDYHLVRLKALKEVGPAVFFSVLVIGVAFATLTVTVFWLMSGPMETLLLPRIDIQPAMLAAFVVLPLVTPGIVEIEMPFSAALTQQHGFLHAGVLASVADSACGYAAATLMPPEADVLSIEFQINLMAPARGDRFLARGRVLRAGRTITTCLGEVVDVSGEGERAVATMLATMMTLTKGTAGA